MTKIILRCFVPLLLMLLCFGLAVATLCLDEKIYREGESLSSQRERLALLEKETQVLRLEVAESYSCEALARRIAAE